MLGGKSPFLSVGNQDKIVYKTLLLAKSTRRWVRGLQNLHWTKLKQGPVRDPQTTNHSDLLLTDFVLWHLKWNPGFLLKKKKAQIKNPNTCNCGLVEPNLRNETTGIRLEKGEYLELERLKSLWVKQTRDVWEEGVAYLTRLDAVDQEGVWVPLTPSSAHDALNKTKDAWSVREGANPERTPPAWPHSLRSQTLAALPWRGPRMSDLSGGVNPVVGDKTETLSGGDFSSFSFSFPKVSKFPERWCMCG